MAKWIGSAIVGAASGRVGGVVFRKSKMGNVVAIGGRLKRVSTPAQNVRTVAMATAQAGWKGLGDLERKAWRNAAGNRTYPDALGVKRNLSGYQLYMKQALAFYGKTFSSTYLPPTKETPGWASLTWSNSLGLLRLHPTLVVDPGVNVVWVVNGYRPGTNQPIANVRRWYFVTAPVATSGGYIFIAGSEWPSGINYRVGERMLLKVYPIALDCWVGTEFQIEVQWS